MDEEELESSLHTYKAQLQQVEQALQAAGSNADLETLKNDLTELVNLTQESLLSLKKSKLLKQLDEDHADYSTSQTKGANLGLQTNSASHSGAPCIDEEYAAFQEFIGDIENSAEQDEILPGTIGGEQAVSDMYKDIIGTKCQAPFSQDWGHKSYGNALIVGVESEIDTEIPKVKVMFCNPTHQSMLPCKYFLSGSCRFDQDQCRFSHGYAVPLEELKEYVEHDHSEFKLESKCLARFHDDLWYKATVVDLHDAEVTVTFDSYQDEPVSLAWEGVIPLPDTSDEQSISSKEDIDDDGDDEIMDNLPIDREESDDDDALPVFLWKPSSHGLGDLGRWEEHTKGIGSRLLQKMGYMPGQGLGCRGEGRVEPVPIQLLPQGKSLDRIMALKELAGDRDIFDAMKQQERKDRNMLKKCEQQYHKLESRPDVFEFINKRLGGKKGKLSELVHEHHVETHTRSNKDGRLQRSISEIDLKAKSDKNLNIQLLKTSEEMKSVEKELVKLKQSLNRNENRDKSMTTKVKTKISSLEAYLNKLKSSEASIESHKQHRKNHKNLTIF